MCAHKVVVSASGWGNGSGRQQLSNAHHNTALFDSVTNKLITTILFLQTTTSKTTKANLKIVDSSTGNKLLAHKSTTPQPTVPTAITFNWTKCKNIPRGMNVLDQPVAINGKLYMIGSSNWTMTVLVYTPDQDSWYELPPPPVKYLTIATLRGQLIVVGGEDKSTKEITNTILTFDESSRQWVQSLPPMPKALMCPEVLGYQDHLIVIGGRDLEDHKISDVNILDTRNKWITAEPLPSTDDVYSTCLIGDTLYLVGKRTKAVFRAHVPSLISQASSGVWESVANVPFYWSSPIAIGNTLLNAGGSSDEELGDNAISSIHLYDPTKDQWTQCSNLPKEMYSYHCIELSGKLYVLGGDISSGTIKYVYSSIPSITH